MFCWLFSEALLINFDDTEPIVAKVSENMNMYVKRCDEIYGKKNSMKTDSDFDQIVKNSEEWVKLRL